MKKLVIIMSLVSCAALAHSHKAHVHGQAKVEISLEKNELEIDLDIPADSVVGFETKPQGEKQTKAISEARQALQTLEKVLRVEGGECNVKKHKVEVDYEGNHSEFEVELEFTCAKPEAIQTIHFNVMDQFSRIQQLNVEFVSEKKQDQKNLKGNERTFKLQ